MIRSLFIKSHKTSKIQKSIRMTKQEQTQETTKSELENLITQVQPEALPQSPSRTRFPQTVADVPPNFVVKEGHKSKEYKDLKDEEAQQDIPQKPNSKESSPKMLEKELETPKTVTEVVEPTPELKIEQVKIETDEASSDTDVTIEASTPTSPAIKKHLLSELDVKDSGKKCLVLDLDETLVHSSFKLVEKADFIVPVEIESQIHNVYVAKRPGVDEFLKVLGEKFEIVVFTASLSKYADPVLDQLDLHDVVRHRLFRESCYNQNGNYIKDLSQLGRPLKEVIIIDNSPASYAFHPENAIPISSWFNDLHDTELTDLVPFLLDLVNVDSVVDVLANGQ